MPELKIGEATFTLRDDFKGRDGWLAYQKVIKAWPDDMATDYDGVVNVLRIMVTDWSLEGEPVHAKMWEQVDAPIMLYILNNGLEVVGDYRKNLPG